MKSFDEFYKENFHEGMMSNEYKYIIKHTFQAGQQSKQAEVDELQKRIDDALEKCYTGIRKQGGDYYLELVEDILKGDQS
ncbi:MAG: hypothetical protein ABS863_00315 [Aerococcus urinaeequi]